MMFNFFWSSTKGTEGRLDDTPPSPFKAFFASGRMREHRELFITTEAEKFECGRRCMVSPPHLWDIWGGFQFYLHPSVSTALVRTRRLKQY